MSKKLKQLAFYSLLIIASETCLSQSLYGVLTADGSLYRANEFGSPVEMLHKFDTLNGYRPMGNLAQVGSRLYGITTRGGINDAGSLYYFDTETQEFSTVMHLNSAFQSNLVSTFEAYSGVHYLTNYNNTQDGELWRVDFDQPAIELVHTFSDVYTYYGAVIHNNEAFIPANRISSPFGSVLYRYNLNTEHPIDSLVFDPALLGSGSTKFLQVNDSIFYMVNHKGAANNYGCITRVNINTWTCSKELDFEHPGSGFSQGCVWNNRLFFATIENTEAYLQSYNVVSHNLDTVGVIQNVSTALEERLSNLIIHNNRVLFNANGRVYSYGLFTSQLTMHSITDAEVYGSTGYFTSLTPLISYASADSEENPSLVMYPNPVKDQFTVVSDSEEPMEVAVYDVNGNRVTEIITGEKQVVVPVYGIQSGMYFVRIKQGTDFETKKLIKN